MNLNEILITICQDVETASKALAAKEPMPNFPSHVKGVDENQYQELISSWAKQIQLEKQLHSSKLSETDPKRTQIRESRNQVFQNVAELFVKLENNGDASDEANKLSLLFPSASAALQWLPYYAKEYAQKNGILQPIHTLCLHVGLNQENITMPSFRDIGKKNLEYLLTHMDELKIFTRGLPIVINELKDKFKLKESFSVDQAVKKIKTAFKAEENMEALEALGFVLKDLSKQDLERIEQIQAINTKYNNPSNENLKEIFDVLQQAQDSDANLPNIRMTSESADLPPGFYMAKLPDNDPRCAMAGMLTGCCQYIGEAGQVCATHAIESELGATYAIFRGKVKDAETQIDIEKDRPLVMSWAWRNEDLVCFDSIEFDSVGRESLQKMNEALELSQAMTAETIIEKMYFAFSNSLIKTDKTIAQVNVGKGGNTPSSIGSYPITLPEMERMKNSPHEYESYCASKGMEEYRDSTKQGVLISRDHPLTFKLSEPDSPPFFELGIGNEEDIKKYRDLLDATKKINKTWKNKVGLERDSSLQQDMVNIIDILDKIMKEPIIPQGILEPVFSLETSFVNMLFDKLYEKAKNTTPYESTSGRQQYKASYAQKIQYFKNFLVHPIDRNDEREAFAKEISKKIPYDEIDKLGIPRDMAYLFKFVHDDNPSKKRSLDSYQKVFNDEPDSPPLKRMQNVCINAMCQIFPEYNEDYKSIRDASISDLNRAMNTLNKLSSDDSSSKDFLFVLILAIEILSRSENIGPNVYLQLKSSTAFLFEKVKRHIFGRHFTFLDHGLVSLGELFKFIIQKSEEAENVLHQQSDQTTTEIKNIMTDCYKDTFPEIDPRKLQFLSTISKARASGAFNNENKAELQAFNVVWACEHIQSNPNMPNKHEMLGEALQAAQNALENANDKTSLEVKSALERAIERLNVPPPPKMGSTH